MQKVIGTRIIVKHKKNFLVLKYFRETGWDFPGGTLQSDESLEECAKRELFEETGIQGNLKYLGKKEFFDEGIQKIYYGYFCEVETSEVQLSGEHSNYVWLIPEDFNQLDEFWDGKIYAEVIKDFNLS